jgi:hypothetical protein
MNRSSTLPCSEGRSFQGSRSFLLRRLMMSTLPSAVPSGLLSSTATLKRK